MVQRWPSHYQPLLHKYSDHGEVHEPRAFDTGAIVTMHRLGGMLTVLEGHMRELG